MVRLLHNSLNLLLMANNIQNLFDFIERAVKSRKYPDNTAQGLKAALKIFDAVLNEEERQSLDVFKTNIEQIYHSVSSKNGKNFNASTLAVYKSRILKLLNDYDKYGIDPTKMATWVPKIVNRVPRKQKNAEPQKNNESNETALNTNDTAEISGGTAVVMSKIELPLRPGVKFVIIVPPDINANECTRIKAVLDSLVV